MGAIVVVSYSAIFGGEPSLWFMFPVLLAWAVVWHLIARRVSELLCPRCGKPAIAGPFFFNRDAKCQHCGFSPVDFAH